MCFKTKGFQHGGRFFSYLTITAFYQAIANFFPTFLIIAFAAITKAKEIPPMVRKRHSSVFLRGNGHFER